MSESTALKSLTKIISLDDTKERSFLLDCLASEYSRVRSLAAITCGNQLSMHFIEPLEELLKDTDPDVRASACTALGNYKMERHRPMFLELAKDSSLEVIFSATKALLGLRDMRSVVLICQLKKSRLTPYQKETLKQMIEECKAFNILSIG